MTENQFDRQLVKRKTQKMKQWNFCMNSAQTLS